MPLTREQVEGLGVALNEAEWHDLAIERDEVRVLLTVLARDELGHEVDDPRRTLRLTGCARLVASYRGGTWDDPAAPVHRLDVPGLRDVLRRYGGSPVYGWDFVDARDHSWPDWRHRLSLDLPLGGPGGHDLTLFQDIRGEAHLDAKVWFAELTVLDGSGAGMDLDRFLTEGRRWWDAMYAGERSDRAPAIVASPPARRGWRGWRDRWRAVRRTPR